MKYDVEELKGRVERACAKVGIPEGDAKTIAEVLVTTDMRGIHSHGVVRLARYFDCIRAGGIKPAAELKILKESPSSLMVSADGGLGIPASKKTMDLLLKKAETNAISIATVNHSDHYGAAGYYSVLAAERGFVGLSMSNTCPLVAPTGGKARTIGNNPFAYSAPGEKYRPVLFDVCMSKIAAGKLEIAMGAGKSIAENLILTADGEPTTDPSHVWKGAVMLPFAEHKGYGFAVMVELMTAALGMSGMMSGVNSWNMQPGRDADTGHSFIVINPDFFGGLDDFRKRTDAMIDELKRCPLAAGAIEILYPGELEWRREAKARAEGLELPAASEQELLRAEEMAATRTAVC